MQIIVTLVAPAGTTLPPEAIERVAHAAGARGEPVWLDPGTACDLMAEAGGSEQFAAIRATVARELSATPVDWAVQPAVRRRKRVLLSDMDSTIIGQECIDELADFAGHGREVADVTARAMAGELDFEAALKQRVALLEGVAVEILDQVLAERITVNPGAATLIATMRAAGAHTILVSGGFTFFTERIASKVGFDAHQANRLMSEVGILTGLVAEPILGRDAKRIALLSACQRLGIEPHDAVAIGDGANDLAMVEAAGLGIAYRAKPVVAARADARIDHGDLTAALHFQGFAREAFQDA